MEKIIRILCLFMLLGCLSCGKKSAADDAQVIDTIPMLVARIQQCSRLYTTEYQVHKIVTHDDQKKLKGSFMHQDFSIDIPAGERKVAIPIDATLKAYIDFSAFNESNVKRKGKKLQITLPDPKVALTASKVNHEGIRQYVALTRSRFTDEELTSFERQGRESILRSIPEMGILESARSSAASTLIPLITQLGYQEENITITFRKEFTLKDLGSLLEKTTLHHGAGN